MILIKSVQLWILWLDCGVPTSGDRILQRGVESWYVGEDTLIVYYWSEEGFWLVDLRKSCMRPADQDIQYQLHVQTGVLKWNWSVWGTEGIHSYPAVVRLWVLTRVWKLSEASCRALASLASVVWCGYVSALGKSKIETFVKSRCLALCEMLRAQVNFPLVWKGCVLL